jgi:predicted DNA binding CopG/RHH family protein
MKKKHQEKVHKEPIPNFRNEDEERDFWAEHDSADYIDWSKAKKLTFPNLKPSTEAISLRLPVSMLNNLKVLANRKDVPYQSLIKMFLDEEIRKEFRTKTGT